MGEQKSEPELFNYAVNRNRPKPENFNRAADLPFQLRLEDFEIADLTKYQVNVYHSLNRALRGLD